MAKRGKDDFWPAVDQARRELRRQGPGLNNPMAERQPKSGSRDTTGSRDLSELESAKRERFKK